jgi:uncharacterized Zn finger protein
MEYWAWKPHVSMAERKREAARRLSKLVKKGRPVAPVTLDGRKIATSFWGIAWCENLERYSDYATRLPRGRSYVRNGAVLDLQVSKGKVTALVSGSELYNVKITVAPVTRPRWKAICRDCSGAIDSLLELLQGRLAKAVMDRVCREGDGLFPTPSEIKLSCDCPDWADMCKHVAAALYGVGARLDQNPELLFVLRGVDEGALIAGAGENLVLPKTAPAAGRMLVESDMAALFGLDMADSAASEASFTPARRVRADEATNVPSPTTTSATKNGGKQRRMQRKTEPERKRRIAAEKKRADRRTKRSP